MKKIIIALCLLLLLSGCTSELTPPHHYVNASKLCETHDGLVSGTYYLNTNDAWVYKVNCVDGNMLSGTVTRK